MALGPPLGNRTENARGGAGELSHQSIRVSEKLFTRRLGGGGGGGGGGAGAGGGRLGGGGGGGGLLLLLLLLTFLLLLLLVRCSLAERDPTLLAGAGAWRDRGESMAYRLGVDQGTSNVSQSSRLR